MVVVERLGFVLLLEVYVADPSEDGRIRGHESVQYLEPLDRGS